MYTLIVVEDQRRLKLEGLIKRLRSVTLCVQIMPFAYTSLYLVAMIFYLFVDGPIISILDTLFYVSPVVVVQSLVLSNLLKLCFWHKIACTLPIAPQIPVVLDNTVISLSGLAALINITTTMIVAIILLIAAYNVFFKGKSTGE